ncbi:MAG: prenyltransferase/squalene oxidase repeat-containing protein [Phycisphaerales bacterium]
MQSLNLLVVGSLCLTAMPTALAQNEPSQQQSPPAVLDERINREKMTEYDPPPMPQQVVLPMPPDHRLAATASDVPIDAERWAQAHAAIAAGLAYLRTKQNENGAWLGDVELGPTDNPDAPSPVAVAVTAMALKAYAQMGIDIEHDRALNRALGFMLSAREADGSFGGGALANYVASTAVSALASLDESQYEGETRDALQWLQTSQWDSSEGLTQRADWFGGAGYGNNGRPDLSNTQMMLEALYDAGLSPDEPAFQNALCFLARTQNLEATNTADWAGNDGGFVYTPANGGESMASELAGDGRSGELIPAGRARSLRSYGSMTYAGFKSMLYAGLSPDDVRVRAAFDWISNHFTFEANPGLGDQGLYYYYHTMSRALRVAQHDTITDQAGVEHNWRAELIDAIIARQGADGSWQNPADRWLEGMPEMATIYAVLALEEALK